jgi:hypothetical protein
MLGPNPYHSTLVSMVLRFYSILVIDQLLAKKKQFALLGRLPCMSIGESI